MKLSWHLLQSQSVPCPSHVTIDKSLLSIAIDSGVQISQNRPHHGRNGQATQGNPAEMAEPPPPPALISCDEAGFTGPKLLDDNQPIFAYAAIDLSAEEAAALVTEIRTKYRIQAPELKSKSLRKRDNWPVIALDLARRVSGRAIVIAADKRLNLGGKAFEYLFEP
ncbi:DUF3800 domain-containing protein, partial [Mesorhizobium sp. M1A.F.Ca.IN.022.05.2.1]